jgi:hypothetical protein
MKQPGTLVRHDGREYLLVEGGYNGPTRAVILLVRPGDPRAAPDPAQRPLRWGRQGEWLPLARWTQDDLRLPDERNEPQRDFAQGLIDEYIASRPAPTAKAWTALAGPGFSGQMHASLPMGLAVACHETREAAAAAPAAAPAADRGDVVPIDNVGMFLTHLVRAGYAGALWNGTRPVFFCVDDEGDLQFLRISPAGSNVAMEILDEHDRWQSYDGAEAVEFIDNREACDQRLVESLGSRPPEGWPATGRLWSIGPRRGVPGIFTTSEGSNEVRHAVLFCDEPTAREYQQEQSPAGEVFPVEDLVAFLTTDEMQGNVATLNPGGHRARSALLWSDGERVVLDNYAGFWTLEGNRFERVDVTASDLETDAGGVT